MPYKKRKETGYPTVPKCVHRSGIIYGIQNKTDGKWFVGQTGRPVSYILREKRIAFASGQSSPLFDAMREYGPDKFFLYELQRDVPWESLDDAQNAWMDKLNSLDDGYNRKRAGSSGVVRRAASRMCAVTAYRKNGSLIRRFNTFDECDAFFNWNRGATGRYYDGPPERRTGIGKSKVTLYFPDPV